MGNSIKYNPFIKKAKILKLKNSYIHAPKKQKMRKIALLVTVATVAFFACTNNNKQASFFNAADRDTTINPVDDFYDFANGGWFKRTTIKETESSAGGFTDLYNNTQEKLKTMIEDVASKSHSKNTPEQMVGDFYKAAMDSVAIDKVGYQPIKSALESIEKIASYKDIMVWIAEQKQYNFDYIFQPYVAADEKNSSMNILSFYQGGLSMPDREYYFKTDPTTQDAYNALLKNIKTYSLLTGKDSVTALKNATTIYNLEKKLAAGHRTNVELRNPQLNYNKMAVTAVDKLYPNINFSNYLKAMKVQADSVNISQPNYFSQINTLLSSEPIESWKAYLAHHTIANSASALSQNFVDARFEFGKVFSGQKKLKPRWERMTSNVNTFLGDALGQVYVKKYFPPVAKERMMDLVNNLGKAFEARINKLDWMSDSTKLTAKQKLSTFLKKIGYPEKWKDYKGVEISPSSHYSNLLSVRKFEHAFEFAKIGKAVDKTEWLMSAPTINAYYNPTNNEIVFPAGILQFPFFDLNADDAINYGGIGMVIGHEMTHGFDDQGAQYDKEGNMKNWWGKSDLEKFNSKTKAVIDLYNGFKVLDTVPINGALTLGENIADMGGLAIAYDAFKLTKQGQGNEKIDGFTPDQRFFLSFAQIWQEKMKNESLISQINTDPHSPSKFRVMGPLMHFDPFYKAFNVTEKNKMWVAADKRIRIW